MTGREIRAAFLKYFREQGHTIVPSSPLVPQNDPSLLFTNAGMVQFKDVFLGREKRPYRRAASCQKCVRAGGKHNDLENVGQTARHHTFFEMLGNFSFGDYFKKEAIAFAWEFLTRRLSLPARKLWVSVFREDDEAEKLWRRVGVVPERIVRLGEKDNFWSMGEVGPCGPCSEIVYDQGPAFSCGRPQCRVGCDCDRYLELWNLVFMQYERDEQGRLTPLPEPSIDTGMGLERISAVMQGVASNFESDLFRPLVAAVAELAGVEYKSDRGRDVSLHVVADHARAVTFLINDRVAPANEGRGYLLRRIIRRASRHGRLLGLEKPFLYRMVGVVVDKMRADYPELDEHREYIASLVLSEEERFSHTLEQGLRILNELSAKARAQGHAAIPGAEIFKLYDTYGFPLDLTREILQERGLSFAREEFDRAMRHQQEQARRHWKGEGERVDPLYRRLAGELGRKSKFCRRPNSRSSPRILAIIRQGRLVDESGESPGEKLQLVLDRTPFYPEKGGQVADTGHISTSQGCLRVQDVQEPLPGLIVHTGLLERGPLRRGERVKAEIDGKRRRAIECNHTATHILQAVLRRVLGDHVKQAGSLVAPQRLRFDFTHFSALTPREIGRVEELVNEQVRADHQVRTRVMDLDEAIRCGATALFDEKYEQQVRVVSIGDLSKELCAGTHLRASGQIGLFRLVSEGAVAAGIRRIEALTGEQAYLYASREAQQLAEAAAMLHCPPREVGARLQKLLESAKRQEKELGRLKNELACAQVDELLAGVREVAGVKVLAAPVAGVDGMEGLRCVADALRGRLSAAVIVLGARLEGKVALFCLVGRELIPPLHAGDIIRQVAAITGGGGGGRPDMAQAGGKDVAKLKTALEQVAGIVEKMLGKDG